MRRVLLFLVLLAVLANGLVGVVAAQDELLVDRIVAVVDATPILLSDVQRVIALGLVEPRPDEDERSLQRRVLDGLIEQRIRLREVERFGFGLGAADAVDAQLDAIRLRFPDQEAFARRLGALGLDENGLRRLLQRQVRVLRYVEERLGPRVFIDLDDIQTYYDETLVPAMHAEGAPAPPLDEVRESIRGVLRQIGLNREIAAWTAELRDEAEVVDLFDHPITPLPPVLRRIEAPP